VAQGSCRARYLAASRAPLLPRMPQCNQR
jgi:hypothetical protein